MLEGSNHIVQEERYVVLLSYFVSFTLETFQIIEEVHGEFVRSSCVN